MSINIQILNYWEDNVKKLDNTIKMYNKNNWGTSNLELDKYNQQRIIDDYKNNNGQLCKCDDETKRAYRNAYSNVRNAKKQQEQAEKVKLFHDFIGKNLDEIFNELGFQFNKWNEDYHLEDSRKLLKYIFNNILTPALEAKGIYGIKIKSTATIMSHKPFDFSNLEIKPKSNK